MKCICLGICQLDAISKILKIIPTFTSFYNEITCYTIFNLSDEEMENILENEIPNADLVISQPVSESYKNNNIYSTKYLKSKINPNSLFLVIPNCYFTGYDPIPFQTTDVNGHTISYDNISYFPSICLESLLKSDFQKASVDWCNIESYSKDEINKNYEKSINELKRREKKIFDNDFGTDIIISDYIEKYYKEKFLFNTYNHPSNILLIEVTKRILEKLAIPSVDFENKIEEEYLGQIIIPPVPCIYFGTNMNFNYSKFKYGNKSMGTREAMIFLCEIIKNTDPSLHDKWMSCYKYGRELLR